MPPRRTWRPTRARPRTSSPAARSTSCNPPEHGTAARAYHADRKARNISRQWLAMPLGTALLVAGGCASDGGSPLGLIATEEWVRGQMRQQSAQTDAKLAQADARVAQVDGRVTQVAAQRRDARKVADDGVRRAAAVDARLTQALAEPVQAHADRYGAAALRAQPVPADPEHRQDAGRPAEGAHGQSHASRSISSATRTRREARWRSTSLSWRREEVVRRYLTDDAAMLNRISFIGLGEEKADRAQERRPGRPARLDRDLPRGRLAGQPARGFDSSSLTRACSARLAGVGTPSASPRRTT